MNPKRILLASHGSEGAKAAEAMALSLCRAGTSLYHLYVVPDFWKGMIGDDWLNSASTRATYGRYVESELGKELDSCLKRVATKARKRRARYTPVVAQGKPAEVLAQAIKEAKPDLVVLGSLRPRNRQGLRSRMITDEVLKQLRVPFLVVPA
jgi:nucleotide-binding universal stress UspA family protein